MKNNIIIIGLFLVILLMFWKGCQIQNDRDNLLNQVSNYQIGEKAFKKKILEDSSTLSSQTQTILTQKEAIELGQLKIEGQVKKVTSQVRETQKIVIDSVFVPFIVDNVKYDTIIGNSLVTPKSFYLDQKWYSIGGKVEEKGILMDSIKIFNESSVTIGWKNAGFLGLRKEPIVEIKNTNPYLEITKMNNVIVKKKKNIFQSPFFWLGLGVIGGRFIK